MLRVATDVGGTFTDLVYFEIDEKSKTANLTDSGNDKAEIILKERKIINEGTLYDISNVAVVHHINQALRANKLFEKDFQTACEGADRVLGDIDIDTNAKEIIIEMVYQMGEGGVSKFKGMLSALSDGRYTDASDEMIDSLWYRQTPNRASALALAMREIDVA